MSMNKRTFPESELIINNDGSCFHLHLKPEQLADRIILVGDPARVNTVADHFDSKECEVSSREFHTITGMYKAISTMLPVRKKTSIVHSRWYASAPAADYSPSHQRAVSWPP